MAGVGERMGRGAAVAATLALAFAASAGDAAVAKRKGARGVVLTAPLGGFTPAAADPRAAASFARAGVDTGGFRFTPSAAPGSRRAVTVAVRAKRTRGAAATQVAAAAPVIVTPITPSAYNLGVSIGWKRFALTGDVARVETGLLPGGREQADVALTYGGRRWSGRLGVAADRAAGTLIPAVGADETYSFDLGGSYSVTRNIAVTAGARYRIQRDRLEPLADLRRDSQAIYLGTAFQF